jgi:prolyl-tRNA synthetase
MKSAVTPTRKEDFPLWYQEALKVSGFAEHAPVRGCMIILPNGYAIWENIQSTLDKKFKAKGVQNAYFPLFIPLSFLEREAEHVEGFAKETAIVTHTRLEKGADGKLIPVSPLEEPLVVRPTSETIIGDSFSRWIQSYRDLPMKINQWCNVVRWEMRPRLFLRTSEFLWQEGHTAHATAEEGLSMAREMLETYASFAEEYLAIPVIRGEKSEGERFPGAMNTFTFEAMMQDGKALQMGTSHYMGTNFAKACGIKYLSEAGTQEFVHTTSWGVTTRMIGAMIMTHGDDNGVIVPPRIAAKHVVIIPFTMKEEGKKEILDVCHKLADELRELHYVGRSVEVAVDDRDMRAGEKSWDAIKKGTPIRLEIGARDIESGMVSVSMRHKEKGDSLQVPFKELKGKILSFLDQIHREIYDRALVHQKENTFRASTLAEFKAFFEEERLPSPFVIAPFNGDKAIEASIQKEYGVSIRCIPHEQPSGVLPLCLFTKTPATKQVIFARSY